MKHFIIAAEIYLAGGCFWGTEHFLKQIRGVESTEVGYANSIINQPTYQQVCSGETNAAETVKVVYDPETVNLSLLLDLYFKTIDPTSLNRQGNDRGTQYRTGIYYTNKADIAVVEIDAGELGAGSQEVAAVRARPAVAGDRRRPELNQRNGNVEIVHRNDTLRMQRHGDRAA